MEVTIAATPPRCGLPTCCGLIKPLAAPVTSCPCPPCLCRAHSMACHPPAADFPPARLGGTAALSGPPEPPWEGPAVAPTAVLLCSPGGLARARGFQCCPLPPAASRAELWSKVLGTPGAEQKTCV